jgi:hypothetical protein
MLTHYFSDPVMLDLSSTRPPRLTWIVYPPSWWRRVTSAPRFKAIYAPQRTYCYAECKTVLDRHLPALRPLTPLNNLLR